MPDVVQLVKIRTNDSRRVVATAQVSGGRVAREELRLLKEILAQKVPGEAPRHENCFKYEGAHDTLLKYTTKGLGC